MVSSLKIFNGQACRQSSSVLIDLATAFRSLDRALTDVDSW